MTKCRNRLAAMAVVPAVLFRVLLLAGPAGRAWADDVAKPAAVPAARWTVSLTDGSVVKGTLPAGQSLTFRTDYLKAAVAMDQVAALTIGPDREKAVLEMRNGDRLTGFVESESLKLTTAFGELNVPISAVRALRADWSGLPEALTRGLVLYYTFDKDEGVKVTDQSGHGNDATVHGAKWTAKGKAGGAYEFDGSGAFLQSVKPLQIIGAAPRTMCAWVRFDRISANKFSACIEWGWNGEGMDKPADSNGQPQGGVSLLGGWGYDGGGKFAFSSLATGVASTSTIGLGEFHHVAAVFDGTNIRLYLDGRLDKSFPTPLATLSTEVYIGKRIGYHPDREWFKGALDDVRIYDRALSAEEIKQLCGSDAAGPILHYTFDKDEDGKVTDRSGHGNDAKIQGAAWTPQGKLGGAYAFDGVDDHMAAQLGGPAPGTKELTVACWAKASKMTPHAGLVCDRYQPLSLHCLRGLVLDGRYATCPPAFFVPGGVVTAPEGTMKEGEWVHLVGVWKAGTTLRIYANGKLVRSNDEGAPGVTERQSGNWKIGWDEDQPSRRLNGAMDDVRIYERALSATEVEQLYRQGADQKTRTEGAVLRLSFDKDEGAKAIDKSGRGNDGAVHGAKWVQNGKVGGAYDLNGKTDYIELGPSNLYKSTGQLSACAWVYIRNVGATPLSNYHGGNAYSGQFLFSFYSIDGTPEGGILNVLLGQGDGVFVAYRSEKRMLPLKEWHHVAFSYDESRGVGNKIKLYLDGEELKVGMVQSEGNGGAVLDIGENLRIMAHRDTPTGTLFDGLVDEVMIFDRALSAEEIRRIHASDEDRARR